MHSTPSQLIYFKVKVKKSPNRPGVAQRVPGGLGFQISWHSAQEGGEVVSLTHLPPLPPGMFLVLFFTRGWVDPRAMERSEGDMSMKNPVTPPWIDPRTVRLVAQRLNHYATPGPIYFNAHCNIFLLISSLVFQVASSLRDSKTTISQLSHTCFMSFYIISSFLFVTINHGWLTNLSKQTNQLNVKCRILLDKLRVLHLA
jgi:hypothetical protein